MKLRVMTYNIAGGRDYNQDETIKKSNPSVCAEVIKKYSPDIVGLNEVDCMHPRSGNIDIAAEIGKITGHNSRFAKATQLPYGKLYGDYGNAFLTKYPIKEDEVIIVPDPIDKSEPTYYETRCVYHATLDIEGKDIEVLVTHFGLAKTERAETMKILTKLIKERKHPMILMGDFNERPFGKTLAPLFTLLHDTAAVREEEEVRTFPSRFNIPNVDAPSNNDGKGIKIDSIFVSEEFTVHSFVVPEEKASDHLPCYADLSI